MHETYSNKAKFDGKGEEDRGFWDLMEDIRDSSIRFIALKSLFRSIRPLTLIIFSLSSLYLVLIFLRVTALFPYFIGGVMLGYLFNLATLTRPSMSILYQLAVEEVKKVLPLGKKVDLVIDAGCGEGYSAIFLAEKFPDVRIVAIDKNKNSLKKAKRLVVKMGYEDKIKLLEADLEEELQNIRVEGKPFRNRVDLAICQGVFTYLKFPELMVRNLIDVLAPEGVLFVSDVKRNVFNHLVPLIAFGLSALILDWISSSIGNFTVIIISRLFQALFGLLIGTSISFILGESRLYTGKDVKKLLRCMGFNRFFYREFKGNWYFTLIKQ